MFRARLVRVVAVMLAGAGVLGSVSEVATAPSHAAIEVTPEALLAAGLQWRDVTEVLPNGADWWPSLPQFNTGIEPGSKASIAVVQEFNLVSREFQKVMDDTLVGTVLAFETESGAKADYARRVKSDGGRSIRGPRVRADQWRFSKTGEFPAVTATLRWRLGRLVGRISGTTASGPDAKTLAALYERVRRRLTSVLTGRFRAPTLSAQERALLPPAAAAPGEELGTAKVPAAAWATVDLSEKPLDVRAFLENGGADSLLFRRYLAGAAGNVVEVVLFPFTDAQVARNWVRGLISTLESSALDPGSTGDQSGFGVLEDNYELQFAKGRAAGDVSCYGAFEAKTSAACEGIVRKLAESWYAALPES